MYTAPACIRLHHQACGNTYATTAVAVVKAQGSAGSERYMHTLAPHSALAVQQELIALHVAILYAYMNMSAAHVTSVHYLASEHAAAYESATPCTVLLVVSGRDAYAHWHARLRVDDIQQSACPMSH